MEGNENLVETDVDMLVSLVKEKGKISIEDAARTLKVRLAIVQRWVDFLLEENVLGVEYKFVTPYLYFNKDLKKNPTILKETAGEYVEDKKEFFEKAKSKGLSKNQIQSLWKTYLDSNLEDIKEHFFLKARSRNISEVRLDQLWNQYVAHLQREE